MIFLVIAAFACASILVSGIFTMAVGGAISKKYTTRIMFLRVIMQAITLMFLLLLSWWWGE